MKKIIISSLFLSFSSFSADISFNWLNSSSGNKSALSGTCDYINSDKDINCNLRQLSVRNKLSIEGAEKNIKESIFELDGELKNKTIKQFVAESKKLTAMCDSIPFSEDRLKSFNISKEQYNVIVEFCDVPSKEKLIELVSMPIKRDVKTCKVADYDLGNFQFTKITDTKWVSTNEPSGECGTVTIMTLEKHPEHNSLWNYSQIRHYTNTESKLCAGLAEINEPMSYSWNGKGNLKMNCEYIEFGM